MNLDQKGIFIVFEGLDGTGKSIQASLLNRNLSSLGYKTFLTEQPSKGKIGEIIRKTLKKQPKNLSSYNRDLALLFALDRYDHLYNKNGIMKKIKENYIVICTRYVLSSLAYNCETQKEMEFVKEINQDFPLPDITFFLDCPVDICFKRLNNSRKNKDFYENKKKLFKVKSTYGELIKDYEGELHIIKDSNMATNNETIKDILISRNMI